MITRELKEAVWEYDAEKQVIYLHAKDEQGNPEVVVLDKVYAFSLCRFLIRVFQIMGRKKKIEKKI